MQEESEKEFSWRYDSETDYTKSLKSRCTEVLAFCKDGRTAAAESSSNYEKECFYLYILKI